MGGDLDNPKMDEKGSRLHSAFKRLRVDSNNYVNRKTECILPEDNGSAGVNVLHNMWSRDCDHELPRKKGKNKAVQKCKVSPGSRKEPYPQDFLFSMQKLTFQKEECKAKHCSCSSSHSDTDKRNKYNYAHASGGSPRHYIREARLKLHHSEKDRKHIIRAARLKLIKHERKSDMANFTALKKGATLNTKTSYATNLPIFGSNFKSKYGDYAQVCCKEKKSSKEKGEQSNEVVSTPVNVKQFTGIRNHNKTAKQPLKQSCPKEHNDNLSSDLSHICNSNEASAIASISNEDQYLEKSCSQEARLDDMTVNELACYFDDFVHIPKKMSSMAEMMYI